MSTLPNRCLSSTTFLVEEVKIRRPARAQVSSAAGTAFAGVGLRPTPLRGWRGLKRLDWRKWTGVRLRYQHGRDPYVIVNARGREWAYTWDTAILDILRDVANR
jgi:hypothetical protein